MVGHQRHNPIGGGVGPAGYDLPGHEIGDRAVEDQTAKLVETAQNIAFRDDSVDGLAVVADDQRTDAPTA